MKRGCLIALVLLVVLSFGGVHLFVWSVSLYRRAFLTDTIKYRLTLTVDVEGRPVEGSTVVMVAYVRNVQLLGDSSVMHVTALGEAAVVDLGPRGLLFALMTGTDGIESRSSPKVVVPIAFGVSRYGARLENLSQIAALTGSRDLPFDLLPLLVRFRDLNVPASVERVDPNDLASSFGPGVRLVQATMTIVDPSTPLTDNIIGILPWVRSHVGRLDGQRFEDSRSTNRFANSLSAGSFRVGYR